MAYCYEQIEGIVDILIKNMPQEATERLADQARQLGQSRHEYMRRLLLHHAELPLHDFLDFIGGPGYTKATVSAVPTRVTLEGRDQTVYVRDYHIDDTAPITGIVRGHHGGFSYTRVNGIRYTTFAEPLPFHPGEVVRETLQVEDRTFTSMRMVSYDRYTLIQLSWQCQKCGHIKFTDTGDEHPCPKCGALALRTETDTIVPSPLV